MTTPIKIADLRVYESQATLAAVAPADLFDLAAAALFELVKLEAEIVPGEGLAWSDLTDGQRAVYRALILRAVDQTSRDGPSGP